MKTKISAAAACLIATSFFTNVLASELVIPLARPVRSLTVQGSGQWIVAQGLDITRFNADGRLEDSFAFSGLSPTTLAVENDEMVLAYKTTAIDGANLVRVNLDAARQTPAGGQLGAFVLQPDGKIVALTLNPPGSEQRYALSRLNPDATLDPSFASTPFGGSSPSALALQEDGKVIVAAAGDGAIVRFNKDGSRDLTFNAPLITPAGVESMVVQPDGKIIIGGHFFSAGPAARNGILRLNPDGTLDSAFNPAPEIYTPIDTLALQANGKILLSGSFRSIGGMAATNLARLNPDGTLDSSFAVGYKPPTTFETFVLLDDGTVVAGAFTSLVRITNPDAATQTFTREGATLTWLRGGSSPELFHARFQASLDGINWTDLGAAGRVNGGWRLQNASIPAGARLRARGDVTGASYHVDYVPGAPALYSQPSDRGVMGGTNFALHVSAKGLEPMVIQWFKDGQPVAGANSPTLLLTNIGGAMAGGYSAVVSNSAGSSASRVAQLTVVDPVLLTEPNSIWINAGGSTNLSVTAAGSGLSYQWKKDGQNLPGATSPTLEFSKITPAETGKYQVIITGAYGAVESALVTVRVNTVLPDPNFRPNWMATTEWFPIQTAVAHNNELFMGGLFLMLDGSGQRDLVKLRADGSVDPLFTPKLAGGEIGGVTALSIAPNGQLLVGGNFMNVNGSSRPHLARLNADGTLDEQFRPVIAGLNNGLYTQVTSIEILADGRILIGGGFAKVEGHDRSGLALLLPDGRLDESFKPDPAHAPGITWGTIVQPSGKIIAYGWGYGRFLPDGATDLDFAEAVTADTFQILPLASGQLFINSQKGVLSGVPTLTDPDGNPDLGFKAPSTGVAVEQANEEIVAAQFGFFNRTSLDGVEDPGFSPLFDNYALYKAMRGDGSMLLAGGFSKVAGINLPKLALLKNTELATQTLTFNGTNATWLRSATSPEVTRAIFEFSADGVTWTHLGAGVRVTGGWQSEGLRLNSTGKLRARGFFRGNIYDTTIDISSGLKLGISNQQRLSGEVVLNVTAPGATLFILQMSTDLRHWTSLQTNTMTGLQLPLTLTSQTAPFAFYRLVQTTSD